MEATILDLRYKMKDVLKAIGRREKVKILYHGTLKGIIVPADNTKENLVENHSFFGMRKNDNGKVQEIMKGLRGGRYNDF